MFLLAATSIGSLWCVYLNGRNPVQLTTPLAHISMPAVSPVAKRLAYVTRISDVNIWRTALEKRDTPERLIVSNFLNSAAEYSPDGKHIAFRSDRSGANEIWTCASDGSHSRQNHSLRWTYDRFAALVAGRPFQRRMPINGGAGTPVIASLGAGMWGSWAISGNRRFYLQRTLDAEPGGIFAKDLKTGKVEQLGRTQFMPSTGDKCLAVSPDHLWLLYAQRDVSRSNIMLVDGFE